MRKKMQRLTVVILTLCLLLALAASPALAQEATPSCGSTVLTNQLNNAARQALQDARSGKDACELSNQLRLEIYNLLNNCTNAPVVTTPTESEQPAKPTCPVQPTKPTQPSEPTEPTTPTTPVEPATPAEPSEPATPVTVSAYASEVARLVNVERAKYNLDPLTLDTQLCQAAQVRAKEITSSFSHTRPNGSSCFSVLSELGISYRSAGENIAIGQQTPAEVVQAWMNSEGHRANILGSYSKIGVALEEAGGAYRGYAWAQFFTY